MKSKIELNVTVDDEQWTENTDIGNLWTGGSASQGA